MFNLERAERIIIAFLVIGLLAALGVVVYRAHRPSPPLEITRFDHASYKSDVPIASVEAAPVNINTAAAEELTGLTGVGKVLAGRIVAYREAHGRFLSPADIKKVKGIGEATFTKNKDRITIE